MKVDGSLKSLLQGVSQQPPRDRLPGQCTAQENMSSDPVTGLTDRPPSDLVSALYTSDDVNGWHKFKTKDGNKFIASVHDSVITVTDLNGDEYVVNEDGSSFDYIDGATSLKFATINDDTYIINTDVVTAMTSDVKSYANRGAGSAPMGIIQILGGAYYRDIAVTLNGTLLARYTSKNAGNVVNEITVRTSYIAARLVEGMLVAQDTPQGDGGNIYGTGALAGADWTVTRFEDVITIRDNRAGSASDGLIFTLAVADDSGNINAKAHTTTVPDVSDLPRIAPQGYVMRVATETDPEEDLWVQFQIDSNPAVGDGFGIPGAWVECVAPGVEYKFDLETMPHVLSYDDVTQEFTFGQGDWADRRIGTLVSNPLPSFVGNSIMDISTFQSRLVMLSSSFVIMSRTNRYQDFWLGSASALVDDDPIDISSTALEASVMTHAVPHNKDLVIITATGQFIIFGRTGINPKNAALVLTTAFETELAAKPVPAGRNVFLATSFGRFAGMREFYTEGGTDINDTRPITQHVKKYLLGKPIRLVASSNYDILGVHTDTSKEDMYIYQYIWSDSEKVQSSWSRWSFHIPVAYSFFDEELFYVVLAQPTTGNFNEYQLVRMSLDVIDSEPLDFAFKLDSRFDVAGVSTQFILPYDTLAEHDLVVVQGGGCPNPGMQAPIASIVDDAGDWVVTLEDDMDGGDIVVGIPYYREYRPTMPLVKDGDGVVVGNAKLRVKNFTVALDRTGYIAGQMLSAHGDGPVKEFQGRIVGDVGNLVGEVALSSGSFVMPFRKEVRSADFKLYSDSYLPLTILDVEWGGQYNKRGKRIAGGGE